MPIDVANCKNLIESVSRFLTIMVAIAIAIART